MLMTTHDLPQPSPHAIALYRIADCSRRDETGADPIVFVPGKHTKSERLAAMCATLSPNPLELRTARQAPRAWK
jgi:hypothetical protein